jgi:short-subunit dehydrogenase
MRHELRPFGVHVILIEPGDIQSELVATRSQTSESRGESVYKDGFRRAQKAAEKDERNAPSPLLVARCVERALTVRAPRLRYTVGMLGQRIVAVLKRLLPTRLFEWAIRQAFQIEG